MPVKKATLGIKWLLSLIVLITVGASGLWSNSRSNLVTLEGKADRIVVLKSQREMRFFRKNQCIFRCPIALGGNPLGHKQQEGDEKTPEGHYTLDWRNNKSTCYKSIHISYPNQVDQQRAQTLGVSAGGNIMIHGLPNGWGWLGRIHRWKDWTDGCLGVTNEEMDAIWTLVDNGTPIEIK